MIRSPIGRHSGRTVGRSDGRSDRNSTFRVIHGDQMQPLRLGAWALLLGASIPCSLAAQRPAPGGGYRQQASARRRSRDCDSVRWGRRSPRAGSSTSRSIQRNKSTWYVAAGVGRGLEDHQRRHHLDTDLRRPGLLLDRSPRHRPQGPAHGLGGNRRAQQPAERRLRRRRLQVHRRRENLDQHRPQAVGQHRPHRDRSAQQRCRICRRAGTALVRRRRAWRVQDQRWRRHLDPGAQGRQRMDRRQRGPSRSAESRSGVCLALAAIPPPVGLHRRRPRFGHSQVSGRREDLEKAEQRPSHRGDGQGRACGVAGRSDHRVCDHRGREPRGRRLPLDRRGARAGAA